MTVGIYTIKGKNNPINLTQPDFIAKGGEGSIYHKGQHAFKIYDDPTKMIPTKKIQELSVLNNSRLIKPEEILLDKSNKPVGYSMRFVDNTYVICQLFPRTFRDRNQLKDSQVLNLVESMQRTIHFVHSKGILLVDINEMNLLVTKDFKEVYFIDVDSYQTPSFPATAIMESVRDRHARKITTTGGSSSWKWDENTDWFSFAVVSFQLFVGIHPYRGKHAMYTDPQSAMDARMNKNVSVFNPSVSYPKNAVLPFSVIPKAYLQWYKDVFENGCRSAPPINPHGAVIVQVKNNGPQVPDHTNPAPPATFTFAPTATPGVPGVPIPPIPMQPLKKKPGRKKVAPVIPLPTAKPVVTTDVLLLSEIETYSEDIVNCFAPTVATFINNNPITSQPIPPPPPAISLAQPVSIPTLGSQSVVVTKSNFIVDSKVFKGSPNSVVGFTKTGQPIAARIDKGQLILLQIKGRKKLDCDIKAKNLMIYNGNIYVHTGSSIVELQFLETSDRIIASTKIVSNVLENATELYPGVSIQNTSGIYFASIFPQKGKCYQFKLPELSNVQLIDAKYDNYVLMILAKDRTSGSGTRYIFRFDVDFSSYDCRVESSTSQELNFVVSSKGVCLCITDDTELELFRNKKDSTSKRKLTDQKLPSGLLLYKSSDNVLAAVGTKLYKVDMKAIP